MAQAAAHSPNDQGDFLSNISRFQVIESTLREGEQYVGNVRNYDP